MSEARPPYRISLHRLPEIMGKKSLKIEQFHARFWREHSNAHTALFRPRIPLRIEERNRYFAERFRLRIDGRWHMEDGIKYTLFTQGEVDRLVNALLSDG
jgi:hypothetical protein